MKPFGKVILFLLSITSISGATLLTNSMSYDNYSRLLNGVTTFSIGILAVAGAWFAVMIPEYIRLARTIKTDQNSETERDRAQVDANIEELEVIRKLQKNILLPIALGSAVLAATLLLTLGLELFPYVASVQWMSSPLGGFYSPLVACKFIAIAILFLMYLALGVSIFSLIYSPASLSHRLDRIYNIERIFRRHPN